MSDGLRKLSDYVLAELTNVYYPRGSSMPYLLKLTIGVIIAQQKEIDRLKERAHEAQA